ncbi:fungal-specific transcription factor domain-containing protein [Mycena belliarum]|uniref:Fungal-specific transcription factor domain-containing protein n=1 Tax=Mycena belliarum TaxID=1033014 RepID=A0AAD6TNM5_9AGAR|nr:fungal-specific transcription factor domain-containing protein [Mycena belliae]
MSSDEDSLTLTTDPSCPAASRKPKLRRSCDFCRQRKSDGYKMPDHCFNCLAAGRPCTYLQPRKKRGPKHEEIEDLRRKNASLEAKLRSLSICSLCGGQPMKSTLDRESLFTKASGNCRRSSESANNTCDANHSEDDFPQLSERFHALAIKTTENKYFGTASSFSLVTNAIAETEKYSGRRPVRNSRPPLFWETLPWEKEVYDQRPRYVYPPSDLMAALIALYFEHTHPIMPVLHRPAFEQSVAEGLHLKDPQFGALLLAVLGVSSRYSSDLRVLVSADASLSSGWKFVKQFYCLMTSFSFGTSTPHAAWLYLGLGIRSLQKRGVTHRKHKERRVNSVDELWNRSFWCLFYLDRLVSLFLGRPTGIHTEDYDVDLPLEVDDEYWKQGFTQPPGNPSVLSYFTCNMRLCEILGDALRLLYASEKLKTLKGWSGPEWEQHAVAELDSALNNWFDAVPDHLRWNPERTPDVFFAQSVVLYTNYYYIQIAVHNKQYSRKATSLASSSHSICTSAARSALDIAVVWLKKVRRLPPEPFTMNSVFVSYENKDLVRIDVGTEFLRLTESRWQPGGRLRELLQELKSVDAPLLAKWAARNQVQSGPTYRQTPSDFIESTNASDNPPRRSFEASEHPWEIPSNPLLPVTDASTTAIYLQQLLADTAEFDTTNLSGTNDLANSWGHPALGGMLDDELAALWMAAPSGFGEVHEWEAYLETEMMDWPDDPAASLTFPRE